MQMSLRVNPQAMQIASLLSLTGSEFFRLLLILRDSKRYQIIRKVGRGKYSEVFKGIDVESGKEVSIKYLKPVRPRKILRYDRYSILTSREVKILQQLSGGPSIVPVLESYSILILVHRMRSE